MFIYVFSKLSRVVSHVYIVMSVEVDVDGSTTKGQLVHKNRLDCFPGLYNIS